MNPVFGERGKNKVISSNNPSGEDGNGLVHDNEGGAPRIGVLKIRREFSKLEMSRELRVMGFGEAKDGEPNLFGFVKNDLVFIKGEGLIIGIKSWDRGHAIRVEEADFKIWEYLVVVLPRRGGGLSSRGRR